MNILFVCLGNICRSPLAEGVFKYLIKENEWMVDSAGTSAHHIGEQPDSRSIQVAKTYGIHISNQTSRQIIKTDFYTFNYIFAMDKSNLTHLKSMKPSDARSTIILLRSFDNINNNSDVPDPYYGGENGFKECFKMIERSCQNFLNNVEL
jgi:protein-tyrosine-phosphatase